MVTYKYLYDPLQYETAKYDACDNTSLSYCIIENGYIFEAGVYDVNKKFIKSTNIVKIWDEPEWNKVWDENIISFIDETVIFIGNFNDVWGHCLTDGLKRVWFLWSNEYVEKYCNLKICFCARGGSDFRIISEFRELLQGLDIGFEKWENITEIRQYKRIIIPDESWYTREDLREFYFTNEYKETIKNIIRTFVDDEGEYEKNIYWVHETYGINKDNEHIIAQLFEKQGFKLIKVGDMSFREELNTIYHADTFAASIGSSSLNMMFQKENAKTILIPRWPAILGYQQALDQMRDDLKITYINSDISLFRGAQVGYHFVISDKLLDFFEITNRKKYVKRNVRGLKKYFCYNVNNLILDKEQFPKVYYELAMDLFRDLYNKHKMKRLLIDLFKNTEIFFSKCKIKVIKMISRLSNRAQGE